MGVRVARFPAAKQRARLERQEGAVGASEGCGQASLLPQFRIGARVGQALARGDDTEALAALDGLSESDDQRTRDKADIGRAAAADGPRKSGQGVRAGALGSRIDARVGRIERQAQLLLKSCGR